MYSGLLQNYEWFGRTRPQDMAIVLLRNIWLAITANQIWNKKYHNMASKAILDLRWFASFFLLMFHLYTVGPLVKNISMHTFELLGKIVLCLQLADWRWLTDNDVQWFMCFESFGLITMNMLFLHHWSISKDT